MADATSTAAVAGTTGALTFPVLAAFGVDPLAMVPALIGCVIAQTLIPSGDRSLRAIALITLGSVLLASLLTPIVAPYVMHRWGELAPGSSPVAVRALVAAGIGGFAQPIVIGGLALLRRFFATKLKEAPDA